MDAETLLRTLFDARVRLACAEPFADEAELLAPERAAIAGAIEKRRREFATGRVLARRLLAEIGLHDVAIARPPDRAPVWPAGVVGSISHTDGLCAVVIAHGDAIRSLGIDVEKRRPLRGRLLDMILTPAERQRLLQEPAAERDALALATFSAKEAFYKCQHPISRTYLGFQDVEIALVRTSCTFTVTALPAAVRHFDLQYVRGRYATNDHYVAASAILDPLT